MNISGSLPLFRMSHLPVFRSLTVNLGEDSTDVWFGTQDQESILLTLLSPLPCWSLNDFPLPEVWNFKLYDLILKTLTSLVPGHSPNSPWITLFLPPFFDFPRKKIVPAGFHSSWCMPLIERTLVTGSHIYWFVCPLHQTLHSSSPSCSQCLVCFWQIAVAQ